MLHFTCGGAAGKLNSLGENSLMLVYQFSAAQKPHLRKKKFCVFTGLLSLFEQWMGIT